MTTPWAQHVDSGVFLCKSSFMWENKSFAENMLTWFGGFLCNSYLDFLSKSSVSRFKIAFTQKNPRIKLNLFSTKDLICYSLVENRFSMIRGFSLVNLFIHVNGQMTFEWISIQWNQSKKNLIRFFFVEIKKTGSIFKKEFWRFI